MDPADRKNKVRIGFDFILLLTMCFFPCMIVDRFLSNDLDIIIVLQFKIQQLLKEGWLDLPENEKDTFRAWTEWDKKRFARDQEVFRSRRDLDDTAVSAEDDMQAIHVPKKRKEGNATAIPKKKRKPNGE